MHEILSGSIENLWRFMENIRQLENLLEFIKVHEHMLESKENPCKYIKSINVYLIYLIINSLLLINQ